MAYNYESYLGKRNPASSPYDTSGMTQISSYLNPNALKPGGPSLYSSKSWLDPGMFSQSLKGLTGAMPLPPKPTYTAPTIDPNRVEFLAQQMAAPERASLEDEVQRIISKSAGNPIAGRMATREALSGYGKGLGSIMGSAQRGGLTQATAEMQPLMAKAQADWQVDMAPWQYAQREQTDLITELLKQMFKGGMGDTRPPGTYYGNTNLRLPEETATESPFSRKAWEKYLERIKLLENPQLMGGK